MKFFNIALFAAMAAAVAIPLPISEADLENLRARGVSEADIAHALAPSPAHPVASLMRRNIDTDAEVPPSFYASPHPVLRRWSRPADSASEMSAIENDGSLEPGVKEHKLSVVGFIDNVLNGRMSGIAQGQGGHALVKRGDETDEEKRSYHDSGFQFGPMRSMSRYWKSNKAGSGANANAHANKNKALSSSTAGSQKAGGASTGELTRPERWVYRW